MRTALLLPPLLVMFCGCTLTPEQEEWNREHHVWDIPLTPQAAPGSTSPFNDKTYADPNSAERHRRSTARGVPAAPEGSGRAEQVRLL